jgi:hypothetical protein
MCLTAHSDPRIRRLIGVGMIFLALSFSAETLKRTLGLAPMPADFLRGICLGICLAMEIRALLLARRLRRNG